MGVTGLVSHEPTLPESSGHEDQLTEAQLAEILICKQRVAGSKHT